MQRIRLLYEQIEEAKRLMLGRALLQLRLALILLDNAAELMMYRELSYQFVAADYFARSTVEFPSKQRHSDAERRRAEQEFRPKVKLLSQGLGIISSKQATILCVCHQMRNDAFHRGEMNPAILGPVADLLFLTVAELTKAFPIHSYAVPGGTAGGENADFLIRLGLDNAYELSDETGKEKMYLRLVEGIAFDFTLHDTLSQDLEGRLDGIVEGLSYLSDTSDRAELDYKLRYQQFWRERSAEVMRKAHEDGRVPKHDLDMAYEEWSRDPGPRFTMDKIERWKRQAALIAKAKHPADALAKYLGIERAISALEDDIHKAVAEFDEHINMLVKERRRC